MTEVTPHLTTSQLVAVRTRALADISLQSKLSLLPSHLNLVSFGPGQRRQLFDLAIKAWQEQDVQRVKPCLVEIKKDGKISIENHKILKETRGFAKLSRSAYQLFDESHRPPDTLYSFTKALGKLIDNEEEPNLKLAENVLKAMQNCQENLTFRPCTNESYVTFINENIQHITTLQKSHVLTPKLFHDLRKKIGTFMDLYRLVATLLNTQETIQTYLFLLQLNRQLGNKHDVMLGQVLKGQMIYSDTPIQLTDEERLSIGQFLTAVANSS